MKRLSRIVVLCVMLFAGCAGEPVFLTKVYDVVYYQDPAWSGTTSVPQFRCRERIHEHGKMPYYRDCK